MFLQFITSKYTIFIVTLAFFLFASWINFGNNVDTYILSIIGHIIIWEIFYKKHYIKIIPERKKIKIAIKVLLERKKAYLNR